MYVCMYVYVETLVDMLLKESSQ
uniref:Uncharacterized protein n=1 Tax=Anguilla anguilla TaxID=7936 RepID=A0A0E9Y0W1_ANGAN